MRGTTVTTIDLPGGQAITPIYNTTNFILVDAAASLASSVPIKSEEEVMVTTFSVISDQRRTELRPLTNMLPQSDTIAIPQRVGRISESQQHTDAYSRPVAISDHDAVSRVRRLLESVRRNPNSINGLPARFSVLASHSIPKEVDNIRSLSPEVEPAHCGVLHPHRVAVDAVFDEIADDGLNFDPFNY